MHKDIHNTIKRNHNRCFIWTLRTPKKEQWIQNFALEYDKHFSSVLQTKFAYS